jgi:hypothetical protein
MSMSIYPQERDGCHVAYGVRWGDELIERFAARHQGEG